MSEIHELSGPRVAGMSEKKSLSAPQLIESSVLDVIPASKCASGILQERFRSSRNDRKLNLAKTTVGENNPG